MFFDVILATVSTFLPDFFNPCFEASRYNGFRADRFFARFSTEPLAVSCPTFFSQALQTFGSRSRY